MQARWYQIEALTALYQFLATEKGHPIIALPTGTGKSFIIADFMRGMRNAYPDINFLCLTHVKELIQQNMDELLENWPSAPAGIYSAGIGRSDIGMPITFAGIASVHKKPNLFENVHIIFIDEAHLISHKQETMYRSFLNALLIKNPNIRFVGLTATDYRLGLGRLTEGGLFTKVCYNLTDEKSFQRLIADGFMVPLVTKKAEMEYDLTGVRTTAGEYNQKDLHNVMDDTQLTEQAVKEIIRYGENRNHILVFASGVEHAEHVAATFIQYGVQADYVHSKLCDGDRDDRIADFKNGLVKVLVNNTILTTGFNFPALDMIAVLSATKSSVKWVQMLGRGTRPCREKHNCLILDFAGNTVRNGAIDNPVIPKKKGEGGGTAPVKLCPQCDCYNHASVTVCEVCGYEMPRSLKIAGSASNSDVMKAEPIITDFKVDHVTYKRHKKRLGHVSLQVNYYCGLRMFKEFVCLEHPSKVKHIAIKWWRNRCFQGIPPQNVAEALTRVDQLHTPTYITVHVNAPYPRILDYKFNFKKGLTK